MKEYIVCGVRIIHAKDSEFNKEMFGGIGFVAKAKDGSEYYGSTKNQAFQTIISARGVDNAMEYV